LNYKAPTPPDTSGTKDNTNPDLQNTGGGNTSNQSGSSQSGVNGANVQTGGTAAPGGTSSNEQTPPPNPATPPSKYVYEIKVLGAKRWIVVYKEGSLLWTGPQSFQTDQNILVEEAKSALQGDDPEIQKMTPK
jgi:hypothetical protein